MKMGSKIELTPFPFLMPKISISFLSFSLIYVAVFVNVVAFSMVFPLLPQYAKTFQASNLTIGLLGASFAFFQFLFSPFWGKLSDHFGRKPILAAGLAGVAGTFLLFGFAPSLLWLFIARSLQGMFSGATIPTARAYIADLTSSSQRVQGMGRIGASAALGVVLGPTLGGILAEDHITSPFLLGALIAAFNFLFVLRFLPESLHQKSPGLGLAWQNLFYGIQVWQGLKSHLAPFFLFAFSWSFILSTNQVSLPLLGLEKLNLGSAQIGTLFGLMGAVLAFVQFFLLPKLTATLGERLSVPTGLFLMALGFSLLPFMPTASLLYLLMVLVGFGSAISRPVNTALISQEAQAGQGITMGTANAFESLGRLVGPFLGGSLFALGGKVPFLFSGFSVILILFLVLTKINYLKTQPR